MPYALASEVHVYLLLRDCENRWIVYSSTPDPQLPTLDAYFKSSSSTFPTSKWFDICAKPHLEQHVLNNFG